MRLRFKDRREAGRALAEELREFEGRDDIIVLALPRGGVPVAFEVAASLRAPLDVFVVRKLGVPGHEELAFGAIASGGARILNTELVHALGLTQPMIERITDRESLELTRRERLYRESRPRIDVSGKTVIIVDDGLATGATMRVAVEALKKQGPHEIVVAAPIGSRQTCAEFLTAANALCVCTMTPEPFYGVGAWYENFAQTTDDEVRYLLDQARESGARRIAA